MTPNLAIVHVWNPHWRGFRLWLPLFLLWIPLILLSPLILIVIFGLCLAGGEQHSECAGDVLGNLNGSSGD
jgi:hypothetical protein